MDALPLSYVPSLILGVLKNYFIPVPVCECLGDQKKAQDTLKLELQAVVSCM